MLSLFFQTEEKRRMRTLLVQPAPVWDFAVLGAHQAESHPNRLRILMR